jgi:phenylacetate-CoA ligase
LTLPAGGLFYADNLMEPATFPSGYRIIGRERDLFFNPDREVISAFEIDEALPMNFTCWHWSLVQASENRWDFQYVADEGAPEGMEQSVAAALGQGMRVNLFRRKFIRPASNGKFSLLKPLAR